MKDQSNTTKKETAEPLAAVALREQVEKRAYHIWLAAGGGHGEHLGQWLQAESEVLRALNHDQAGRSSTRNTSARTKLRSSPAPNGTVSKD